MTKLLHAAAPVEVFTAPSNYSSWPQLEGQANTFPFVGAGNDDIIAGASGGNTPNQNWGFAVHNVRIGYTWYGKGVELMDPGSTRGGSGTVGGARCLSFWLVNSGNAHLVVDFVVKNSRGVHKERVSFYGRTHDFPFSTGFTNWTDAWTHNWSPMPIVGEFYNPNALTLTTPIRNIIGSGSNTLTLDTTAGLGAGQWVTILGWNGAPSLAGPQRINSVVDPLIALLADPFDVESGPKTITSPGNTGTVQKLAEGYWARLPVTDKWQMRMPSDSFISATLVERSGTGPNTTLVPVWNTLNFGLSTKVSSVNDIVGGWMRQSRGGLGFNQIFNPSSDVLAATTITGSNITNNRLTLASVSGLSVGDWIEIDNWNGQPSLSAPQQIASLPGGTEITLYANPHPTSPSGEKDITVAGNAGNVQKFMRAAHYELAAFGWPTYVPHGGGLHRAALSVDPTYNVVKFTALSSNNPHVYGFDGQLTIGQTAEGGTVMPLGGVDQWELYLMPAFDTTS